MDIYVLHDGKEIGPLTQEKTRLLLNQGSILPDDLAWTPGMAKWEPLTGILPPADELAGSSQPEPAPAPAPAATFAPIESSPLETATQKQRALLAFLHIGFSRATSKVEAAMHISDALENPAYATRFAQWPTERLKLHGDLFVAELQARKENRAHHYHALAQSEGAALFNGVTKAHAQSVITHLDLENPQWEANESTAAREIFFPAVAEKYPQLVRPDAPGRLNLPAVQKSSPESGSAPSRKSRSSEPGRAFPVAGILRGLFFLALLAGIAWFVMKVLKDDKKPGQTAGTGATQSTPAVPPGSAAPDPTAAAPTTPPPTAEMPAPAEAPPTTTPAPMAESTPPSAPAPAMSAEPAPPPPVPAAPAPLVLTKPFAAQLTYGTMTLPAGTALKFIGQEGALMRVQYLNNTFLVPPSATNHAATPATMPGM